jgi:hypothetical protein
MDTLPMHPRLRQATDLSLALFELAAVSARAAAQSGRRLTARRSRNLKLAPGAGTPLWNELVEQTLPLLTRRGSKAHLARILGLPRQRLQDCLKARSACLDAERTLLLLCWVTARQEGRDLIA